MNYLDLSVRNQTLPFFRKCRNMKKTVRLKIKINNDVINCNNILTSKPFNNNINQLDYGKNTDKKNCNFHCPDKPVFFRFLCCFYKLFESCINSIQLYAYLLCHRLNISGIRQKIKGLFFRLLCLGRATFQALFVLG